MKALIFDVDGTLAETEELHRAGFNTAFAAAGLGWHWDVDTYRRLLTTTGGKERIARYAAETGAGAVPVAALHAEKTRIFGALMAAGGEQPGPSVSELRPGILRLMTEARRTGILLAVATTTSAANVEALCRAVFGQPSAQVFDVVAAGDQVAEKKPAPDVYLLALRRLGLRAAEAVAFEDSANGVRAARAAGLPVILSRGLYTLHEADAGATLALDCFSQLGGLEGVRRALAATPSGAGAR